MQYQQSLRSCSIFPDLIKNRFTQFKVCLGG
jgi:hypothetical protein